MFSMDSNFWRYNAYAYIHEDSHISMKISVRPTYTYTAYPSPYVAVLRAICTDFLFLTSGNRLLTYVTQRVQCRWTKRRIRPTSDKFDVSGRYGDVVLGNDRVFPEGLGSCLSSVQLRFNDVRWPVLKTQTQMANFETYEKNVLVVDADTMNGWQERKRFGPKGVWSENLELCVFSRDSIFRRSRAVLWALLVVFWSRPVFMLHPITRKPSWRKGYARQQCVYTASLDFWNSKVAPLVRTSPKTLP